MISFINKENSYEEAIGIIKKQKALILAKPIGGVKSHLAYSTNITNDNISKIKRENKRIVNLYITRYISDEDISDLTTNL